MKNKKDKMLKKYYKNKVEIMKEEWDYLIILDACRYDYFKKIWKKYFNKELSGELTKKISVGSATLQWRNNSFNEYYDDVIYVSSNPYINSIKPVKGFLGSEYFHKVYDVWKYGWDAKRGTVLPVTVTNTTINALKSYKNKRIIIHYLQPHAPYLSLNINSHGFPLPDLKSKKILQGIRQGKKMSKLLNNVIEIFSLLSNKFRILDINISILWKLAEILNISPVSPIDYVRRKYGKEGLRKAYMDNLEIVIKRLIILLNYLSGRIIITADHGELLGESGCYGHPNNSTNPYLIEIPWLILKQKKQCKKNISEKLKIKSKINSLKSLSKI